MTRDPATRFEVHHGRVVRCLTDRPQDLRALFAEVAERDGAAVAIVDGERRSTFAELDTEAETVARNLWRLGIRRQSRVAILLDNRAEFVSLMLACIRLGAIFVPMNFRQRRSELTSALSDCAAELVVHEAGMVGELPSEKDVPALRWRIAVGPGGGWPSLLRHAPAFPTQPLHEDEAACILYTSGTTGRSKGAVLTHCGIVHNIAALIHHIALERGMTTIQAAPMSHVAGLVVCLLPSLAVGGTLVMQRDFRASAFLALAECERIDWAILVPAMYNLCLRELDFDGYDLSRWRIGLFGGAPMPDAVGRALALKMPHMALHNIYGATETSAPAVIMPSGDQGQRTDCIGRPIVGCDVIVMGEDGREVPHGEPGEVWIGGPATIPRYWQRPQADAEAFVGGYWRSGDVGIMHEDGYLQICDRKKDMIIRGGFKIYSVEVEAVLAEHPWVVEAAVTGYACAVLGERVAATIRVSTDEADAETLRDFCALHLSAYKVPERIVLVRDPLARNANGKLQKMLLRTAPVDAQSRR